MMAAAMITAWLLSGSVRTALSERQAGALNRVPSGVDKNWRPRTGTPSRAEYAGPQACAICHTAEASGWQLSQMARALKPVGQSQLLRQQPHLRFNRGPYHYRIDLEGDQATYSVDDGKNVIHVPLLWQFGNGVVGKTFMFKLGGVYYETEVAYYPVLQHLDVVAGLDASEVGTVRQAFGLPLAPDTVRQCITCHTTAAVTENQLRVESMIPGVTCEACHGPGAKHVTAMRAISAGGKPPAKSFIFNPGTLEPEKIEGFCGACHRTTERVLAEGLHGLDTIHYEPYRLEMSSCWIMTQRINCLTCHNPHQPLQRNLGAYDQACLSCHAPAKSGAPAEGKACPVATQRCVTCHMPKCRIPLSPFTMSDHFIRVVRSGDLCVKY